jgi:2-polyprenyl-3-methyl-5-hydroxy-6-metoxy-1,4-benzoquinol methylase
MMIAPEHADKMKNEIMKIQWSWDHPIIQDILLTYYREWLFNTPEIATNMVEKIMLLSGVQPPGQIVDIGCGLGYHAIAFAQKGFQVLAFDPGDKYLEIAKDSATRQRISTDRSRHKKERILLSGVASLINKCIFLKIAFGEKNLWPQKNPL